LNLKTPAIFGSNGQAATVGLPAYRTFRRIDFLHHNF
jgi:hypothetical protein